MNRTRRTIICSYARAGYDPLLMGAYPYIRIGVYSYARGFTQGGRIDGRWESHRRPMGVASAVLAMGHVQCSTVNRSRAHTRS